MTAWKEMFTTPHGAEDNPLFKLAQKAGLTYVQGYLNRGENHGVIGNTYALREKIKASGFRWNADCKVWYVGSDKALDSFTKLAD